MAAAGFADRLVREDARADDPPYVDIDIKPCGWKWRTAQACYVLQTRRFSSLWDARCKKTEKAGAARDEFLEADGLFYFGTGVQTERLTLNPSIQSYVNGYIGLNAASKPLVEALYGEADLEMQLYDGCKDIRTLGRCSGNIFTRKKLYTILGFADCACGFARSCA
jgi:hypothetical protein